MHWTNTVGDKINLLEIAPTHLYNIAQSVYNHYAVEKDYKITFNVRFYDELIARIKRNESKYLKDLYKIINVLRKRFDSLNSFQKNQVMKLFQLVTLIKIDERNKKEEVGSQTIDFGVLIV